MPQVRCGSLVWSSWRSVETGKPPRPTSLWKPSNLKHAGSKTTEETLLDPITKKTAMKISISIATGNRHYGKAMRRILARLEPLVEIVDGVELKDPSLKAILIGMTDDMDEDEFEEIENKEGFCQVLIGCNYNGDEEILLRDVFYRIMRTVEDAPLHHIDRDVLLALFERYEKDYIIPPQ
jgi:hypothetical protein